MEGENILYLKNIIFLMFIRKSAENTLRRVEDESFSSSGNDESKLPSGLIRPFEGKA